MQQQQQVAAMDTMQMLLQRLPRTVLQLLPMTAMMVPAASCCWCGSTRQLANGGMRQSCCRLRATSHASKVKPDSQRS